MSTLISVAVITHSTHVRNESTHSIEITLCGDTVVPYLKGLHLKEIIRSFWDVLF